MPLSTFLATRGRILTERGKVQLQVRHVPLPAVPVPPQTTSLPCRVKSRGLHESAWTSSAQLRSARREALQTGMGRPEAKRIYRMFGEGRCYAVTSPILI